MKVILLLLLYFISFALISQTTPTLVFPKNETVIHLTDISFEWDRCENDSYIFELYQSSDLFTPIFSENTSSNSALVEDLSSDSEYLWRVNCSGNWSAFFSFNLFTPTDLENCNLWVLADSGLVINSGLVEGWQDFSGQNNSLIQPTPANKPILTSFSDIESDAVLFDGVNDFLTLPGNITIGSTFIISNWNSASLTFPNFNGLLSSQVSSSFLFVGNQATSNLFGPTSANYFSNNVFINTISTLNLAPLPRFKIFEGVANSVGAINNLLIGSDRMIAGRYWNGAVPEIIIYDRNLDATEKELVYGYLRSKYAPPVNLGANISRNGLCDTSLFAGEQYQSYLWSDGSTADSLNVSESGTYWVEVIDIFGFTSADTINVRFPEIDVPAIQLYCPNNEKTWYTNLGPDYFYIWSDGSTADSLSINTPGDYHVQITDLNGCVFQSDTLLFSEDPFESVVELGPDINLCSGNSIGLTAGAADVSDYLWQTGEITPNIDVTTSGQYYVDVINTNGCAASDSVVITIIGSAPIVDAGLSSEYCINESVVFQDLSSTTDGSTIQNWEWDFGDGSFYLSENGEHTFTTPGSYTVQLTIETSSGCSNSSSNQITIQDKPDVDYIFAGQCVGSPVSFNGQQNSPLIINEWFWDFDDPASGTANNSLLENPSHLFSSSGSYNVSLIAEDVNGCTDSVQKTLDINPAPVVNFSFQEVCAGGIVSFTNNSTIEPTDLISNYNWQFGDGSSSGQTNPSKPYLNAGNYNVSLSATSNNGCFGSQSQTVKVHAIPQPDYLSDLGCAGSPVYFSDNSFVSNGSVATVDWSFDGVNNVQGFEVSHIFEAVGNYNIEQTVMSAFGCQNTVNHSISLTDFLSAGYDISPSSIIGGYAMEFQNTSIGNDTTIWIINGTDTVSSSDLTWIFPSSSVGTTVDIVFIVANDSGCSDTITQSFPVLENRTDLAINQLFIQESNGFYTIGAELENRGSTPITGADLFLRSTNTPLLKEYWSGLLDAGDKEIYIFTTQIPSTVSAEVALENFICAEARLLLPIGFEDENLSNNESCYSKEGNESILLLPFPNPTSDVFNIRIILPEQEEATIQLFDALGKLITTVTENELLKKGLTTFSVDPTSWAAGTYSIVLITGTGIQTGKIQVVNQD